jgi:hypothetical protein
MELGLYSSLFQAGVDTATTGIKVVSCPSRPIDVLRFGVIPTVVFTAGLVLNCKRRITPGSATGEVSLGILTVVNTGTPGGFAVGTMNFFDINPLLDTLQKGRINPGQQLVLEVTTAGGAATTAQLFCDFQSRGLHKSDRSSAYFPKLKDYTV